MESWIVPIEKEQSSNTKVNIIKVKGVKEKNELLPEPGVVLIDQDTVNKEEVEKLIKPEIDESLFHEEVVKKSVDLKARNRFIHKLFTDKELPSSEIVINDFSCDFGKISGRFFITANYILFCNSEIQNTSKLVKWLLPMNNISDVRRESGVKNLLTIVIDEENEKSHTFTKFLHRKKAFFITHYLWIYSPTVLSLRNISRKNSNNNNNVNNNKVNKNDIEEEQEQLSGKWIDFGINFFKPDEEKKKEKQYEKPNTKLVSNSVALLHEISDMEEEICNKLDHQNLLLDRTNKHLKNIEDDTKSAEKDIKEMDSTLLQLLSFVSKQKEEEEIQKKRDEEERLRKEEEERKLLEIKEKEQREEAEWNCFDIPILIRGKFGIVQHAILRFTNDRFYCFDPYENSEEPMISRVLGHASPEYVEHQSLNLKANPSILGTHSYSYDYVSSVVIRTRLLNLDIRFNDANFERFKCISSYQQLIANEMYLRCKASNPTTSFKVIFEPNNKTFEFGSLILRRQIRLKSSRDISVPHNYAFKGPVPRITDSIIINAPKKILQALDEQDDGIEQIQNELCKVSHLADRISTKTKDSNVKLEQTLQNFDQTTSKVISAKEKVAEHNRKMDMK